METGPSNLPAQISDALVSIPKALVPNVIKALDRLLGAAVDVPVAWLNQRSAKIDAQTESFKLVEAAMAKSVAEISGADAETVRRAMSILVRKEYRKQGNREAVAAAMVDDLGNHLEDQRADVEASLRSEVSEDWLNVFEKYAEDASSERLQGLWGRVLAGEVRAPGRFSLRTLRFLSEFEQADAITLESFGKYAFSNFADKKLVVRNNRDDLRDLINLESNGIIQGASGLGLQMTLKFSHDGFCLLRERDIMILLKGDSDSTLVHEIFSLTPLGQELLSLIPSRDIRASARLVALSLRTDKTTEGYLVSARDQQQKFEILETLWKKDDPGSQPVEGDVC